MNHPNKRKRNSMSEVKNQKNQSQKIKHHILPSKCSSCNNDCIEVFNEENRLKKHEEFCCCMWIAQTVEQCPPKRPKKETKNMCERKFTHAYKLKIDDDYSVNIMKQVGKSFYLSTLGLTSDKMVTTSLSKSGQLDGQGRQVPVNKL